MTDTEAEAYLLELAVMSDAELLNEYRKLGFSEEEIASIDAAAEELARKIAEASL